MRNTLKLKHPIPINNQSVDTLSYDADEITSSLFSEAEALHRKAAGYGNICITPGIEFDFGLHPFLGMAAVIAVNPQYDFSDLERVHGADLMKLSAIGRNFTLLSEESVEKTSEEPSETTPEPITHLS